MQLWWRPSGWRRPSRRRESQHRTGSGASRRRMLGGRQPKPPERRRRRTPTCWSCGKPGHLRRDYNRSGHRQKREVADVEERQQSTEWRRRRAPTCWSCGRPGHLRRDCDRSGHRQEREVADVEERQQSTERRRRRTPNCWSCGRPGHLRRDCDRSGHRQEREGADARRSTSAPSSPSPRLVLKPVDRRCDDGLIAEGRIRGRPCRVLVDTGAMLTIARPDVVRGLPGRAPLRQYELRTASGESLPIQREVFLDLTLGKRKLEMWVFVANITEDVVLGLDAMQLLDATVDVRRRILRLGRDEVFLMDAEDQPVAGELSLEGQLEKQDGAHAVRVSLPSQAKDGVAPP
ncbi:membrane-associated guanylate kinase, WW and PDZ domain-containing protein 1-like [Periplaneta americana]|uniref:membrane-associated guanylate kinase, WW and PDZ domain-containing protein 1-like n=1 Tax=Periplaneta americana TaxID=6978 RepID=UPI0037E95F36